MPTTTSPNTAAAQLLRKTLRQQIRAARQALTASEQQQAASALLQHLPALPQLQQAQRVAVYLSNDAELDTTPLIKWLWQQGKQVYLPVLHLFCPGFLTFQLYTPNTPMRPNRFGIAEPVPDVSQLCPLAALDVIFLPLVAFDAAGNRLGMGGGFYDRTLASLPRGQQAGSGPHLIGLAHNCQQVGAVPTESWDVALPQILTPARLWQFAQRP